MSRLAALSLARSARPRVQLRTLIATPQNRSVDGSTLVPEPAPSSSTTKKQAKSSAPLPVTQPPVFPAPSDPFQPATDRPVPEYSEGTKTLVRGVAKLLGYNSVATTAIRESGRMMKGIVESVERDRAFWYDACRLPQTYQTFFQLHLLYVLILIPRLRTLPATAKLDTAPMSEPLDPTPPVSAGSSAAESSTATTSASASPILTKPLYEAYVTELLSHFFELAESEMRVVLGRGERERVIKKYMDEMGQQWKGAGVGLDYVLGLSTSSDPEERGRADVELASWVWRNLFDGKGLVVGPPTTPTPTPTPTDETDFVGHLETVVRFVRREMARLDGISDEDVLQARIGEWGRPE